ncbi:hypothetical protein ACQR1I_29265 [Bradyrhizobium sp. HKCCYLS2038]|uniref:hypothetical protein n=1 Tax=unclassified Bradyrhizobium TaxID=2631580 RepID=UPI003EBDD2B2
MLRFKVLVSAVPLIAAAVAARLELTPSPRPCIAVGTETVSLGSAPRQTDPQADFNVDFTDDPALATVRVALVDDPEVADFVVIDDAPVREDQGCGLGGPSRIVAIAADRDADAPRIYLSTDRAGDGLADYRIYVRSSRTSVREAAALIVAARSHASSPLHPVL